MTSPTFDFRSDTVTRPTLAMRAAMLDAAVGDDVYGDDPTVNALQDRLARELGFEAGLFVASGTQSNLIALMAHCQRGDEYLVGADAHTYKYEGGGAAVLGSIQPQPILQAPDGTLPLDAVRAAIKPDDPHFARSRRPIRRMRACCATNTASRCTSTVRVCSMPPWRRACRCACSSRPSTACPSACRRA
jgi:threonine aldolase